MAVVKPGRILFELSGVPEPIAREAMRLAIHKLPMKARFVVRERGVMTKTAELREMHDEALVQRLVEAKQKLFNLRFQNATGQLDNVARFNERPPGDRPNRARSSASARSRPPRRA